MFIHSPVWKETHPQATEDQLLIKELRRIIKEKDEEIEKLKRERDLIQQFLNAK